MALPSIYHTLFPNSHRLVPKGAVNCCPPPKPMLATSSWPPNPTQHKYYLAQINQLIELSEVSLKFSRIYC